MKSTARITVVLAVALAWSSAWRMRPRLADASASARRFVWGRYASWEALADDAQGSDIEPIVARYRHLFLDSVRQRYRFSESDLAGLDAEAKERNWLAAPDCAVPEGALLQQPRDKPLPAFAPPLPSRVLKVPFTPDALKYRTQGLVMLKVIVERTGALREVEVVKGMPDGLTESAVRAVRSTRWYPARVCGQPIAIQWTLTFPFDLDKGPPHWPPAGHS